MNLVMLGDFSGRNVGHNVLLLALLHQLRRLGPDRITVPTLRPAAVSRLVGRDPTVDVVGVAPWHGALKFRAPRLATAVRHADHLLLVDNHLHDKGFGNPLVNNMGALLSLTESAARHGVPRVYLHGSVGPLDRPRATALAARLARRLDVVLLRDHASRRAFARLAPDRPTRVTADAGFDPPPALAAPAGSPPDGGGGIAVNIGPGTLDDADTGRLGRWTAALRRVAEGRSRPITLVVTHPRDRGTAEAIARALPGVADLHAPDPEAFEASAPALFGRTACAIGDRYHELVMFAAAGVPVVGLVGGDKVESLFEMLERPELVVDSRADGFGAALDGAVARAVEGEEELRRTVRHLRGAVAAGTASLTDPRGAPDG